QSGDGHVREDAGAGPVHRYFCVSRRSLAGGGGPGDAGKALARWRPWRRWPHTGTVRLQFETENQKLETPFMRAVVQRVSRAKVSVNGEVQGVLGRGWLALLGVGAEDGECDAAQLAAKSAGLRILEDDNGKSKRV